MVGEGIGTADEDCDHNDGDELQLHISLYGVRDERRMSDVFKAQPLHKSLDVGCRSLTGGYPYGISLG